MAALLRRSRCDNKKTITLCLAWCTVLWLTLSGFLTEADGGRLRQTEEAAETTAAATLCGQFVTLLPATVFSPEGETAWTAADGKVCARMPLLLTSSPASLTIAVRDGYFRTDCDGLEAVWDVPEAMTRSPAEVATSLTVSPSPPAKAKLEEGFDRFFLLLVQTGVDTAVDGRQVPAGTDSGNDGTSAGANPGVNNVYAGADHGRATAASAPGNLFFKDGDLSAALPENGQRCTLKTEEGLTLRVTLLSREEEDGYLLFRFSAPASPSLLSLPRLSSAALCLGEETVLSLPASALCRDDAGQAYVLCDRGDRAVARAVEVLSSDGTRMLCAEKSGKTLLFGQQLPYLSAGDRVITDPAGLTHRSLLHRKRDPFSYPRYIIETEKGKKEDSP